MQERIVVTGVGAVSPIGHTARDSWRSAVEGISGVGPISLFDASDYLVQIACEVKNFKPEDYLPAREVRRMDRVEHLGLVAAQEAVRQSGLAVTEENASRVGVVLSSAIGGLKSLQDAILTVDAEGPRRVGPFVIPMLMSNGAAGMLGIECGFKGPSFSVASACASGADGIGMAWLMLRAGLIDAAITGGTESTIAPVGVAAFDRLGAMSRRGQAEGEDRPGHSAYGTPQPFDRDRDGLVMGEGAAVLVLERESTARQRGAVILAELAGYAASADAFHITAPSDDGAGGAQAIRLALQSAGVNPDEVDYINAHGTATPLNDLSETRAIKKVFGDLAYNIPVSSTKSMTGHMMGATGALEAVFCVQAVQEDVIPPTINYQTPDPECDLDYVPNQARQLPVSIAVSNAFGFGGHNAVLVVKKYT